MNTKCYDKLFGVVLVVFLCGRNFMAEGEKAIPLHKNQNSSWHWLTRFEFGPWSGWSRDANSGGYTVCDISETAANHTDSWLVSEYVDLRDANEVHLEIEFIIRQCPAGFPYCKESFNVYQLQTNGPLVSGVTKADVQSGNFTLVNAVNATRLWTPGNELYINRVNMTFAVNRGGVYIAFQDRGACLALISVTLSYTYCPDVINHGVVLKETAAPSSSQNYISVNGTCSDRASPYPSNITLSLTCLSSGQWVMDDKVTCVCTAGYELIGDTCTACKAGYYKKSIGNGQCIACPTNSVSNPSRDSCPCQNGFYRAPQEGSNDSCTAPPSEPRNINVTVVTDSVVMVAWSRPAFDGGRADVKYDLRCGACSNVGSCSNSCLGTQFWPSNVDLTTPQVTMSNLESDLLYNITVISKNGVSDQAGLSSLRYLHRTFSLAKGTTTNPPSITTIRFPVITEEIPSGTTTTVEATIVPGQESSSSQVSAAIGISVAVTLFICFVVAAIIIFLLMRFWRRKQFEHHSVQSSVTQLSELSTSMDGTQLKRMQSVTTTTELSENGSSTELQSVKGSPLPPIKTQDKNANSRPSSPGSRLPAINIEEANSRPNSSKSTEWLPLKRKGGLPSLQWTPPRAITPVLLPSALRKQSLSSALSPRKSPEGSEQERSPSANSWFPAEEVQFNV